MCGICGILKLDGNPIQKEQIAAMADALIHRGRDDEGFYSSDFSAREKIALGFRRLSIIDVDGGHQPMRYENKVIVFNGEIYNFQELRSECKSLGHQFKTQSDTEVLIHLYSQFQENCLNKLNGMFAFAIWDEEKKELFLARDRLGIKPLYYFWNQGHKFIFSSELKSLLHSGEMPIEFDPVGMMDFFTYRFVPGPYTILKNVRKVLPGHWVRIKNRQLVESKYWSLDQNARESKEKNLRDLEEELFQVLQKSVKAQLISDVPLGAFLSGGVDSSLLTALMVKNSDAPVQTFSIGFQKESGVDESFYARKVAKHLGTQHHELILTEKDLLRADKIFSTMNEPVADPTILPTAILSEFARRTVKVVLTGEGGDELFAGYNRYKSILYSQWVKNMSPFFRPIATTLFRKAGRGDYFKMIPHVSFQNWFLLNRDFSPETLQPMFGSNLISNRESYLSELIKNFSSIDSDPLNTILKLETQTALVDRLLMKVDMSSMGQSLEARPPYLDHRVVEFALNIPPKYKIRFFKGKFLLRKVANRFLPHQICWRRKHGFIVPIGRWMRMHPREWIDSILDQNTLDAIPFFNRDTIQKSIEKIYNGKDNESASLLWPVIVLCGWYRSVTEKRLTKIY